MAYQTGVADMCVKLIMDNTLYKYTWLLQLKWAIDTKQHNNNTYESTVFIGGGTFPC